MNYDFDTKIDFGKIIVTKSWSLRAKTTEERLDGVKKYLNLKIAALFSLPNRQVKKSGNFKINMLHRVVLILS